MAALFRGRGGGGRARGGAAPGAVLPLRGVQSARLGFRICEQETEMYCVHFSLSEDSRAASVQSSRVQLLLDKNDIMKLPFFNLEDY